MDPHDWDDLENCPFLKDKVGNYTEEQLQDMRKQYNEIIKPKLQKDKEKNKKNGNSNGAEEIKENKPKERKRHPRLQAFQDAQGACPFLNQKLIEPSEAVFEFGYNIKYKSRMDFFLNYKTRDSAKEFKEKRKQFDIYSYCLKHTLFQTGETIDKIREAQFANAFMIFDDLKQEGNLWYEDEDYYQALNLYEQAYSCFQWLEFKTPEKKKEYETFLDLTPIFDEHVERKEKDLKGDDCEIDTRLAAVVNILLNIFSTYMKLYHYKEAISVLDEIMRLTDLSSDAYFRRSQVRTFNLRSTYSELDLALQDIETAMIKRPDDEKYIKHKEILELHKAEKLKDDINFVEELLKSAKHCADFKKERGLEYKESKLEYPQEMKIMRVMKHKYADVVEFFRDTEDKQLIKSIEEFQEFSKNGNYQKMKKFIKFTIKSLDQIVIDSLSEEIRPLLDIEEVVREIDHIKLHEAVSLFGQGHLNFQLFKYSMEIVFDHERKIREKEEKRKKDMEPPKKSLMSRAIPKLLSFNVLFFVIVIILWVFFRSYISNTVMPYFRGLTD